MTALIISNEEIKDIIEIVKYIEEFGLLNKDVSKTIKKETKEQNSGFLDMLLNTLDANLLRNVLSEFFFVASSFI